MSSFVQQNWKDISIIKSEVITDSWEVAKAWTGRAAEVVLFLCMIANIIEMLPGVNLPTLATNTVLGVQVVMLDVGGFSLATMAYHARQHGNEQIARKALNTAYTLIAVMMITLLLVTVGLLFPDVRQYTNDGEKLLILLRVVMTVWYGHVVHSLRGTTTKTISLQSHEEKITELIEAHNQQIITMHNRHETALFEQSEIVKNAMLKVHEENTLLHNRVEELGSLLLAQLEPTSEPNHETDEAETDPQIETVSMPENETKKETTATAGTAQQRALRIIKRNPNITASELAKKAKITNQYASRILKKQMPK